METVAKLLDPSAADDAAADPMADAADWRRRLAVIVDTMRDMSQQTEPQAMVRSYASRLSKLSSYDRSVSLSRRGLIRPWYKITRSSMWPAADAPDPWKEPDRLPMFDRGLLGQLLYSNEPHLIDDLVIPEDDPAYEFFAGMRSLVALPHYDEGEALNMVVHMRREPAAFDPEELPQMVWIGALFGRATHNLVLGREVKEAYAAVDRELQTVADIQRSLLPAELPKIPGLTLAAHYQTSRHAGGDYYDFFELPDGKWGILIADVSGHGTPAAVIMAILHSIAHSLPGEPRSPAEMLRLVNRRITRTYTGGRGTFITAFYAVYDPAGRTLTYASAGHNPPRLRRCGERLLASLDRGRGLPLGIVDDEGYGEDRVALQRGDALLFYTDGITEAWSAHVGPDGRELFGLSRLDAVLSRCPPTPDDIVAEVLHEVDAFTGGKPATDDRTLLAARVE
jgi:sigma-B regulation protein RsbU (phosphoserine phosphatase)